MRRLQNILIEHMQKQEAKAAKLLAKKESRERVSRENRNQGVADPSQVVARRKEFEVVATEQLGMVPPLTRLATIDRPVTERHRSVLTLKRV